MCIFHTFFVELKILETFFAYVGSISIDFFLIFLLSLFEKETSFLDYHKDGPREGVKNAHFKPHLFDSNSSYL